MTPREPRPPLPRLGRLILKALVRRGDRASVEGDLLELWEGRRADGRRDLRRAFWRDLGSVVVRRASTGRSARLGASAIARGAASLVQDARYALRLVRRQPAFAGVTIGTLAIGIASATAIFTICDRLLLRPLPYPAPDRIVSLEHVGLAMSRVSGLTVSKRVASLPEIAALGLYSPGGLNLGDGDPAQRLRAAVVTSGFFHALGVPPLLGRVFSLDEDTAAARVAVIAASGWRHWLGGAPDLAGREIRLNGRPFVVVGVMPDGFSFPDTARVWIPAGSDYQLTGEVFIPRQIARLAPGVSTERAATAIALVEEAGRPPGVSRSRAPVVTPLKAALVGGVRPTLLFLAGIVGLLLLITCANVAGLLLSRLHVRHRELQLRAALGAPRGRLVQQLAVECLVFAGGGGLAGLWLASWAVGAYAAVATVPVPDTALDGVDLRFFGTGAAVSLLSVLLFAVAPAASAGRRSTLDVMRGSATPERRVRRLASGLVIGQVAAAVVLLAATTATLATTLRLADVETGITNDRAVVFELTLPEATYPDETAQAAFFERVATRIAGHSDVGSIGATDFGPGSSQSRGSGAVKYFGVPDPPYDVNRSASYRVATPAYFKTMGIRLLEGRAFEAGDRLGAPRVAVVSAGVARALEPDGSSVIGQRIESLARDPAPVEIVGVVADVRLVGLKGQELQVYYPLAQEGSAGGLAVAAHATRDTDAAFEAVLGALRAVDPELPPYNVSPIHDLRARYLASERLTLTLSGAFSAVALLLCAIGLYGVLSQAVSQRTREIGVRMALGADRRAVQGQVVWSGLRLASAGALVGGAVSLAIARTVTPLVPTVDLPGVELIAADAAVLLLVAILAAWLPSRRASVIDPVRALRAE